MKKTFTYMVNDYCFEPTQEAFGEEWQKARKMAEELNTIVYRTVYNPKTDETVLEHRLISCFTRVN